MWKIFGKKGNETEILRNKQHIDSVRPLNNPVKPLFPAKKTSDRKLRPELLSRQKPLNGNKTNGALSPKTTTGSNKNINHSKTVNEPNQTNSNVKEDLNKYKDLEFFFLNQQKEYPNALLLAGIKPLTESKVYIFNDKLKSIDYPSFFQYFESAIEKFESHGMSRPESMILNLPENNMLYIHVMNEHIIFGLFNMNYINIGILVNIIAHEISNFKNL